MLYPFFRILSLSLLVLSAAALGGCSSQGIIQDTGGISTPVAGSMPYQPASMQAPKPQMAPYPGPTAQQQAPTPIKAKVALLVPLSGKSASLGQAMANAAQQAVFDLSPKGFELMPRDTKGTAEGAVTAARDALASGAQLIIGPLFAGDVAAVKPVIQPSGVSMLALSTDISLAEPGAYVMGFAPAPQVERVVSFALSKGLHNFAAVVPPGPYGKLVMDVFERAVREGGGQFVAQEPPANVAALAARKSEIEALFLPFGGVQARTIAAQLAAAGFEKDKVRLLGTGLWDEPHLAEGQALLVGGWFAAPEFATREKFTNIYKDTYNQPPPRLATLAYDATALAAVLARHAMPYDRVSLTSPSGFAGLDGVFRLLPNGEIERALAVIELTDQGTRTIDPSPSAFTRR